MAPRVGRIKTIAKVIELLVLFKVSHQAGVTVWCYKICAPCSLGVLVVIRPSAMRDKTTFRDRYPPPWHVIELPGGYEVRCTKTDTRLVIVYEGARTTYGGLTRGEARSLATAIASLGRGVGSHATEPDKSRRKQHSEQRRVDNAEQD